MWSKRTDLLSDRHSTHTLSMNKSSVQTFGYLETHMNLIMCFSFNGFLGFTKTSMAVLSYWDSTADGGVRYVGLQNGLKSE